MELRNGNGTGLESRIARLEAALARLSGDVRARRLVVTEDRDGQRIVAEVVGGTADLSVELPGCRPGRPSVVLVFANPGDEEFLLLPGLGIQLWVDGGAVDGFAAWLNPVPGRRVEASRLASDFPRVDVAPPSRTRTTIGGLTRDHTCTRRNERRERIRHADQPRASCCQYRCRMTAPSLKNTRTTIGELVADYRAGRLVIPEFQRDYVWRRPKAPKLIDSLYRAYPISTLLLWRTSEVTRARRASPRPGGGRGMNWLIDGQQRVMTLDRVMSGDDGIDVLFNPETDQFSLPNVATKHDPSWVRLADLFDDPTYRQIRRELPQGARGAKLEQAFDRVRAIRDYEVPVVIMIDHSFEDAVDAFTRINSLGVRLKQQDIEAARVATHHTGLIAEEIMPFMERLSREGFNRLNVMHLFRVCSFIAHPDGRDRTPLYKLSRTEVLRAWKKTETATLDTMGLMRSELGLVNMDILWSGALLVPLIAVVGTKPARDRDHPGLVGWMALAALLHHYSRSTESALDRDLRACRDPDPIGALLRNLRQHRTALQAKSTDFAGAVNDRSGLLAAYIACKQRGMKDFFTGQKILMQSHIDRHHILPRRQFPEAERSTADTVANIAFIASEVNKAISHAGPEVYLEEIKPEFLQSQCVPDDRGLWRIKQADAFYSARRKLLAEAFNDFLREAMPGRRLR